MLFLVEIREKAEEHEETLVYLLQCLVCIINQNKSMLRTAELIDLTGLTVDTVLIKLTRSGKSRRSAQMHKRRQKTRESWLKLSLSFSADCETECYFSGHPSSCNLFRKLAHDSYSDTEVDLLEL